ncbi:hypothetical protein [Corallincola spongiicola]|uniref:DUF2798 domain-containing protein n=1 Tax=Corallincola spongiicola TaxID=2520508 RepID=A0ABY1WTR7_9GAMM|nr:hypothetical protein [Corallincola spongiicola]TAA48144.1 hypothetical protein EXY25_02575 [Corallincola spongiicola]
MSEQKWKWLFNCLMVLGIAMVAAGVPIFLFTDLASTGGVAAIRWVALLIGGGLFVLIPSKIFVTLILMQGDKR